MSNNAPTPHQAQFMSIGTGNEEEGCANEMLYDEGDDDVESGMYISEYVCTVLPNLACIC